MSVCNHRSKALLLADRGYITRRPTELTAELLNTVIEKIVVHEAVKGTDGSRKQKVDIYYRFIGKID